MSSNFCCCCLNRRETLLPITRQSSSEDSKVLLDYYSFMFKERNSSDFICIRCSKALAVAYHFVNMVTEIQKTSIPNNEREMILDDTSFKEMQCKIQDKQASISAPDIKVERNKSNTKCEVKCQTNRKILPSNEFTSLSTTNKIEENQNNSNTEPGFSVQDKKYKCTICDELFETKLTFFEHNRQNHKEIVPYKCKLCSFYTCYTESLYKHCAKSHGLTNVKIDSYQTKPVVTDSASFGITYFCIPCNFEGRDQTSIDDHLLKEHSIEEDIESFVKEVFHCPLCYRSFTALKSAKIHYSMYHKSSSKKDNISNKRKFDCRKCGKSFDLKSSLFMHQRKCMDHKPVPCNFCKLQHTSVLKYERHLQDMHSVAITHECAICGKTFSCSEYLAVHRKRHNERYYQCELCPKNYINNADLKVHKQRTHARYM